ncbi:50S ribosomal protein L10 [Williamwhitmania taraxaci]|uniref:Large ribosomal subunit protein uL10 n=1 Tax=Williamwhitmania taraxaci TaxID=1640674 RepID=A0A1G6GIT4_9BACT|nr:50S ribosomal protein L10 [Williamwhitmania taraxaci]SDB81918.1 LSU ribosomal protein L10P [Williamwhitmania taraxaci]
MRKEDKGKIIESLAEQIQGSAHFYLADIGDLNAAKTAELRRKCFEQEIKLVVVKNTLLQKAFEKINFEHTEIFTVLNGSTSIMFSNSGNGPAKLIKDFAIKNKKPVLKAAFVEQSVYIGAENLDTLISIKSKNELVADIILMLQTPAKNVISALQSGERQLTGVVKTLSEKE